jgi:ribonuclease P protein component
MVPKHKRVTKDFFERVFKEGKIYSGEYMYCKVLVDIHLAVPHYAVVVPKKITRSAVLRNKFKRQGYAVIKKYEKENEVIPGIYLFFIKTDLSKLSFNELFLDVETIFKTSIQ